MQHDLYSKKMLAIVALSAFSISGCATVVKGSRDVLVIGSEPAGAKAVTNIPYAGKSDTQSNVDGYFGCEPTPCAIEMSRRANPLVTVSLDGYQPIRYKVTSAVATSNIAVPFGVIVAGLPPGRHVRVEDPRTFSKVPLAGATIVGGFLTYGAGAVVDVASGANLNLAPQAVTAVLARIAIDEDGSGANNTAINGEAGK